MAGACDARSLGVLCSGLTADVGHDGAFRQPEGAGPAVMTLGGYKYTLGATLASVEPESWRTVTDHHLNVCLRDYKYPPDSGLLGDVYSLHISKSEWRNGRRASLRC